MRLNLVRIPFRSFSGVSTKTSGATGATATSTTSGASANSGDSATSGASATSGPSGTSNSSLRAKAVRLAYNKAIPRVDVVRDKAPLLIYHGLFGSKVNWKSLSAQFAQLTKREVYAFDLRNHGDSPHTSGEDATLQCMAADIELFMDEKGLQEAALLGHSLGGRVCAQFAFSKPDRVEKLILADISPLAKTPKTDFLDGDLFKKLRDSITVDLPSDISMPEARKLVGSRLIETVKNKFIVDFFLLSLAKNDKGQFQWKFNVDALETLIKSKNIMKIDIPDKFTGEALLIHGANSEYILKEDYSPIQEKVPNAKFVCLEGAGHYLHVEKSTEFIENIVDFLK